MRLLTSSPLAARFLDQIPPEVRVEIYKHVLPTSTLFLQCFDTYSPLIHLLMTCKIIYSEASPIFYSTNNFLISHGTPMLYPPSHALFAHTGEVTFNWPASSPTPADEAGAEAIKLNAALLDNLASYPKLETLHVRGFWFGADRGYDHFQRDYKKEGVMDRYLKHTGLCGILELPKIRQVTLHHVGVIPGDQTKDLEALGQYITKQLEDRRSGAFSTDPDMRISHSKGRGF
jgi:hypothetical protein